ncbi:hypothetical protein P9112_003555 [Eukaryota sp. TZLM1-RC]
MRPFGHPHNEERTARCLTRMFNDIATARHHCITIDNAPTMQAAIRKVNVERQQLGKEHILEMRCFAHIINIIVQAGLVHVEQTCQKIRVLAQKLAASTQLTQEYRDCFKELNMCSIRRDVKTRWNSTYFMLSTYLKRLSEINLFFTNSEDEDIGILQLSSQELIHVRTLCDILKVFYNATNTVSSSSPSIGPGVVMFAEIERQLNVHIENNQNRLFVLDMVTSMKSKHSSYHDQLYNFTTYAATLLDPRFKTRLMPLKLRNGGFREQFKAYYVSYKLSFEDSGEDPPILSENPICDIEYPPPKLSRCSNFIYC